MVRKAKRKDQALQRSQLLSLQTTDTRFFWKKIKQLDIKKNDESSMIPWQVKTNNHVETDKEKVLGFWRNSFDKLYNRTVCDHAYGNVDYYFSYSLIEHISATVNAYKYDEDLNRRHFSTSYCFVFSFNH